MDLFVSIFFMKQNKGCKTFYPINLCCVIFSCLGVGYASTLLAADILYSNASPDVLQTPPSWLPPGGGAVFFPGNSSSWISSGATVTVDYAAGTKQDPSFVYGGIDTDNSTMVQNNKVIIKNGYVTDSVYGGSSRYTPGIGQVINNSVIIDNGTVDVEVIGGNADGWGSLVKVIKNSVTLNAGAVVKTAVKGGYGYGNSLDPASYVNVDDNLVEVIGGIVLGDIFGGSATVSQQSLSEITTNRNKVILRNATISDVSGYIYGGLARHDGIANNTVAIANGNEIFIEGGTLDVSAIYAGAVEADDVQAINNTIEIKGAPTFYNTSIYGGWFNNGYAPTTIDIFSGNTLNVYANQAFSVNLVGNFQNYNFNLEPSLAGTNTALMTAESIDFGNNANNDSSYVAGDNSTHKTSNVNIVGVNSGNVLGVNDRFVIAEDKSGNIDASKVSLGQGGTGVNNGVSQVQQGISLFYNVKTEVINNQIVTTVINACGAGASCSVVSVNPQLKALMEGRLAASMLVTRGGDNIAYNLSNFLGDQDFVNGFTPFVDMRTGRSRYNSGSHINADEHLLTAGLAYKYDGLAMALAYEHGWGSYDSYNRFYSGKVRGSGHNQYYGMAMLGRYSLDNGLYADASFRFGRLRNKFNTSDIVNVTTAEQARYTISSGYKSAHAGVGYVYKANETQMFDISAKYLWSRTPDANKVVAGDKIHFDSLNSHRARVNVEATQALNPSFSVSLGVGYEYEFDGVQEGTTYQMFGIKKASVKGGTGIASIGMNYQPSSLKNLSVKTELQGYTGKREGGSASLTVSYGF